MEPIRTLGLALALAVNGCARGPDCVAASCPGFVSSAAVSSWATKGVAGTFRARCDDAGDSVCTGTDSHGECFTAYDASDQAVESRVGCGGTCADAVCVCQWCAYACLAL